MAVCKCKITVGHVPKKYNQFPHRFMENREDYLLSYGYKTMFCFSPAITIVFTPSFAAAILDEVEMIVDIGPLKCESPFL